MFLFKIVTLKEYEIYLKVKKFIETEGCYEADLIRRLIKGVAYFPSIIESDDTEATKCYSLSAAARDCGVTKQTIVYAFIGIGRRE